MKVSLLRCDSYEHAMEQLRSSLQSFSHLFTSGDSILVKPNMLSARRPEEAVTTHPAILKAVLLFLRDLKCHAMVADSPASGSFQRVAEKTGIKDVCEELNVPCFELDQPTTVSGQIYKKINVDRRIFEVDKIVNVAKLKTHSQMILTLAVKNTFGCVPGLEKSGWHMRCGTNENFAAFLVDLHRLVNPTLNIVDGVVGMEGNGPANGKIKRFGVVALSTNAFVLDFVLCKRLNVDPLLIYTVRESVQRNLIVDHDVEGDWTGQIQLPVTTPVLPVPEALRMLARRLARSPKISKTKCVRCKICEERCPANAINIDVMKIDYEKCIKCYVCHEVCPQGAISLVRRIL
ncbi:MAG: DUF362 domain-containing protein [Pseudothermotoga sp.]|uniref:DUF362 domain-containing protein n=1 Tax=Pseudothermotoga sp. TaxID=2033661 RepID=UPI00258CB3EA|nr:DUF362 domain-containing protein [Pseudothermotoga sp.]MDI6863209.1 DUF362 domain-containing protein [Pseudothermotoga sp.]